MQKNVLISEINIPREIRQRTVLTPESVADLALSIAQTGEVLQRILLDDTLTIIAGERRLTSIQLLNSVYNNNPPALPKEILTRLQDAAASPPTWSDKWTKIPATIKHKVTELDSMIYEFIENAHREDLPWLDRARAVYTIHAKCRAESPNHSVQETATLLAYSPSLTSRFIQTWSDYLKADEKTQSFIQEAPSINSASDILKRKKSRTEPKITFRRVKEPPQPTDPNLPAPEPEPEPETPILHADFSEWAASYTGPAFNILHCDFPYGISLHRGPGQSTAADNKMLAEYDDSPEVYWDLLQTLSSNRNKLIAPSCHIVFWFSQNFRRETEDFFTSHFPDAKIQPHLMIWHRPDNSGILPDPQRYGRRTYETAMLITFGDRMLTRPKALSFSCEWKDKIHRSQKPLEVVTHFLSMFVDESSTFLDPTCGSGTSIIAAKNLNAKSVLGLEKSEETYKAATAFYKKQL